VEAVLEECGEKKDSDFNFAKHVLEVRKAINDSKVIIKFNT